MTMDGGPPDSLPTPRPAKLSAKLRRELKRLEAMPDSEIDTSDIPETLDWSKAVRGRFKRD